MICATFILTPAISFADRSENDKRTILRRDHGYLLLDLDINAATSSLHFAKYRSRLTLHSERKITFSGNQKDFELIILPVGRYQITRINAPYYDLPSELDTRDLKRWSFTIEGRSVNYIGKLTIGKERTKNGLDINLYNHIAKDLGRIKTAFAEELTKYPLVIGVGYTDTFLSQYNAIATQ